MPSEGLVLDQQFPFGRSGCSSFSVDVPNPLSAKMPPEDAVNGGKRRVERRQFHELIVPVSRLRERRCFMFDGSTTSASQGTYRTYMIDQTRRLLLKASMGVCGAQLNLVSPGLQPSDQKMPFWAAFRNQ